MNRLHNTRAYLCGPMERTSDFGEVWRHRLSKDLGHLGIHWLDPTRKPTSKGGEGRVEAQHINRLRLEERYDELCEVVHQIRCIDLRLVDICDFVIVYIDLTLFSCGTWEELFWANRMKKPVLIMMEQGKQNTPSWLFGTIPHEHIFSSWCELYEYLEWVNECTDAELSSLSALQRWEFFNFHGKKDPNGH